MKKLFAFSTFALLLGACSMTPDYQRPGIAVPPQWHQSEQSKSVAIARDWWTAFGSDELNSLMAKALSDNDDLLAGLHRVEQSRAALKIAGASLLPSADASAGASRSRTDPAAGRTETATSLRAGAGISYELDLFGANRAEIEGAEAAFIGSQYDQDALALVVMGDVANAYFSLLNTRDRLAIADSNLVNAREVLRIVQARVDAGSESALELAQQKSSVASREAARAAIAQQAVNAENALAILLGKLPQTIPVATANLDALAIPQINPGQPSSLLERRPDIRAAEADLLAANADIGAARAAFYPSVTLGLDWSIAASGFGDPATTALSLASSLAAPVFQGGRLEGGVEQATARQAERIETYRKTILVAFQEVEDALTAVRTARLREQALTTAMEEARISYDLSKRRYDAGAIDFRTLLDTQDTLLSAEDSHAQAKLDRLSASVDLFLALGGGWAE